MVSRFRERLTFANVTSSIALFAALSTGGAYAADKIGSEDIDKNAVKSKHIKNAQVKGKDIAADAIDSSKVGDGTLLAQDFGDGQLPQGPQGPKGDTGAKGATGPQGPKGDKGDPGATSVQLRTGNSTGWTAGGQEVATASCNSGETLVGGGWESYNHSNYDQVIARRSSPGGNTWTIVASTSVADSDAVIQAKALCASP